jgi:hypothetical protein
LQENALFIQDIIKKKENRGRFPDIDVGDISDNAGDFSKMTEGRNPDIRSAGFPGIRWNPRRSWGFPREGLPQDFPLNQITLISLSIFDVSPMAYSLLSYARSCNGLRGFGLSNHKHKGEKPEDGIAQPNLLHPIGFIAEGG